MRIKKTSETTPTMASVVDGYSTSTQDGYSCNYANKHYEGTVLYLNNNGATGNITLNDSVNNYIYLEIEYAYNGYPKSTGKIKFFTNPVLDIFWYYYDSGLGKVLFQNIVEIPTISGTTITRNDMYYTSIMI